MSSYEKLKKLGWLSAYSRQVLLTRHLARRCVTFYSPRDEKVLDPYLFIALKLCILCPRSNLGSYADLSVPYHPTNRPDTFTLKSKRSKSLQATVEASTSENTRFFLSEGYDRLQSKVPSSPSKLDLIYQKNIVAFSDIAEEKSLAFLDSFLFDEVATVGQGVSLSTKAIADKRCSNIWQRGLFGTKQTPSKVEFFLRALEKEPKASFSAFFLSWYMSLIEGKIDWDLWQELSKIPEAIWDAGPEAVAREIELVKARLLAKRAPQAETIEIDDQTGKFKLTFSEPAKPDLLGATLDQIGDALEDAIANPSNGLHERSREVRVLKRSLTKYANSPQRLEMDFTSVHGSLTRQIAKDELPPSEENLALLQATQEGAQGIRATHPDIAENRAILQNRAIAEMSKEDSEFVQDSGEVLADLSQGILAEEFVEDAAEIYEQETEAENHRTLGNPERNPAFIAQDEKVRFFGRAAKIMLILKKTPNLIHTIDKSATYKATRILTTIAALVTIGFNLL